MSTEVTKRNYNVSFWSDKTILIYQTYADCGVGAFLLVGFDVFKLVKIVY